MKRQIDEFNTTSLPRQTKGMGSFQMTRSRIGVVDANDDTHNNMSFLKGADRSDSAMDMSQMHHGALEVDFCEWDTMTARMEENYEITAEARDYNNADIDDSKSEIQLEDEG